MGIIWTALVSVLLSVETVRLETYLIGIFVALFIIIEGKINVFIFLIAGLTITLGGLIVNGIEFYILQDSIFALVFANILAYYIGYILRKNFIFEYNAKQKLQLSNEQLDAIVRARTEELVHERDKAEGALKLKNVFLTNMSHEIRTPLNGIIGFTELMQNPKISASKTSKFLKIIQKNSNQLLKIIDDIIYISMVESKQLPVHNGTFSIIDIFDNMEYEFSMLLKRYEKKDIEFEIVMHEEIQKYKLYTDKHRIQQILASLLNNAVKFTSHGKVTVVVKVKEQNIIFSIADTGIGISIEKERHIFEQFRQEDETYNRKHGGLGLGLSIAKGITDALGGEIWLDKTYTDGAKFIFTIPITSAED